MPPPSYGRGPVSCYLPRQMPVPLREAARAFDGFIEQEMATYAAALAYRGLMALFPFLVFVIALVNVLEVWRPFDMLADWARTAPQGRVPSAIKEWVVYQTRARPEGAALSVSAVAAAWGVASGARVLRTALNVAGDLEPVRPAAIRVAISFLAAPALGGAVLGMLTLFTMTERILLHVAASFDVNDVVLALWTWIRLPSGILLAGVTALAIYRFAPSQRQRYRRLLPGAALSALVWAAGSFVFSRAVARVLDFGVTYGSFSAAIVLLVYLYISAAGLLFGAELNAALAPGSRGAVAADASDQDAVRAT